MDYQVSQTGSLWRRGRAFTGSDTRNMPIHGYRYFERAVDSHSKCSTWQGHEELEGQGGILVELAAPTTTRPEGARHVP